MKSHTHCVGLTGGIGSGKSVVAGMFSTLGAAVIDVDLIAHQLTGPDGAAMAAIVDTFGTEMATSSGSLDRAAMRVRVFSDPVSRHALEAILHPLIRTEAQRLLDTVVQPYALLVVPLLAEHLTEYRQLLDRIAVVDCDVAQQLARTAARPGLDIEQAKAMMAAQVDRAERLKIADDVIDNRSGLNNLQRQVESLHHKYLRQAGQLSGET